MDSSAPVKGSLLKRPELDPLPYCARVEDAGRRAGFRVERFGETGGCPLLALTRRQAGPRPRLYLSAGIHGDEPAPPLALLEMIESGVFDNRAVWFLCPMLNPVGFARRTREDAFGNDLNRDYRSRATAEIAAHVAWLARQPRFGLTLCVHEDWEASGYYLYEQNPLGFPSLAPAMLEGAARICPVDRRPLIDERAANAGIIRPAGDPFARELWPESIFLRAGHTNLAYTVETPSGLALERRVAAHRAALEAGLKEYFATFA